VLRSLRRRSLIVMVTHFRDEDSAELAQALRLLRARSKGAYPTPVFH
jgi:hypothetical protein